MKNRTLLIWILAFMPLIITMVVLPMLPDKIPVHFGSEGVANRWGSKYEIFVTPIITLIFLSFLLFIDKLAKKSKDYTKQTEKVLSVTNYVVVIIFNALTYWFLHAAYVNAENLYSTGFNMIKLIVTILSVSLIFIGNVLPKCRQNSFVGIRTVWTMRNNDVWYKTHRFASHLLYAFGIVSTIVCLIVPVGLIYLYVFLGILTAIFIIIIAYSFIAYRTRL